MQVDADGPSPTEIAASDDEGDKISGNMEVQTEKRKREETKMEAGIGSPIPHLSPFGEEDDKDLESPSKKPQTAGEPPLSMGEIKNLLCGHVNEMKNAWSSFQTRLDSLEAQQVAQNVELGTITTRTTVLEKDTHGIKAKQASTTKKVDELAQEVQNMKVQMGEIQDKVKKTTSSGAAPAGHAPAPPNGQDPWGDYLRRRRGSSAGPSGPADVPRGDVPPANDRGDTLTEDEKRTLVIGGWLRDH